MSRWNQKLVYANFFYSQKGQNGAFFTILKWLLIILPAKLALLQKTLHNIFVLKLLGK